VLEVPSFFSNKRLIILLVSMIAVVTIVGVSMKERPNPTWPEQFLRDSVGFVQSLAYKPARAVAGFFENVSEMKQIYTENQRLKANLQEHAKMVAKINELETESESLRELLEAESDLSEYKLRPAEVIMRSPDRWYQQITINRGDKHNIRPNMAVITPEGLVGRVRSTAQFTSVVELLTDTNRSTFVSAVVQGNKDIFGIIEGYDLENEALLFRKVPIDAPLEVGQTVITSGLGGLYPRGLFIGEVIKVVPDKSGLAQSAFIKPASDLYHLDYVFVVERSFIPQEDIASPEDPQEEGENIDEDEEGTDE
jgi:rod shape-determining protein MreC